MKKSLFWLLALVLSPVAVLVVITPMDSQKQYIFGLLSIGILFLMGFSKRRSVSVIMVVTSLLMSTRYMYFRLTQTLHFNSSIEAILGMGLFLAEVYIWVMLLLNYLQTVWPLKRGIVPLPDDMSKWPTVDIYIPSYNEPLEVVRDTVLAAQCIDYPKDKMKIYLLDDGKRSEFAVFAADVGVGYITRNDNKHAKAGNLNHALTLTQGELICVFDCDHVATRVFLQATVGGFLKDPMLALVQTPHYFYSPDPFERNLSVGRNIPNEGMLFYGPIQQGNDNWNATFFCGSCAVIRREALAQIGGFAVETVTEDAHTALKFQRLGWKSAFLDIPLAAGLATERLVVHVIQRTRWARGMTQIFRVDNPLFGRGLTFQQRLCYLSAMLYYQFALPRVVFVTAPLAYLLFNLNIIYSSASLIVSYALPHLFLAIYVGSRMNGRYRYSFWGEIYDIVLAFHLVLPTLVTMIFPKRGKFNVTDKGGLLDVGYFDFTVVRPHLVVACLLALGVIVGIVRAIGHDYFGSDPNVIALNVGWGIYSLIFLLAAIAVARETRQVDAPLADGRMFFRTDLVNMDAGSFSTHSDGSYSPSWGTCGEIACTSGSKNQTDSGASVAVGWKNDTWSGDIGTTPMGFNVVDVVGGLSYSSDVGPVGYTVNVHRRPISSSLLSFGGQKDSSSHTGATWGGVRADGGGLSLSYDRGEAHGIWSSLGADSLTGKNVADNWRVRWMTGYYYKVINENNRRVTVGLNNMIWHYDKDLSGYTLGQGGYYSPQEYLSFAVPVTWRQRTENWSWELGGSVSWSHSRTQTQARYPLLNLIPSDYRQRASELTEEGSSSHGFGYTARALVERRVTSNWFVGAAVDIQQAKDYTPSHALLYVRYSAAGWQGDLDMPPQPLVPYADW
ncbi:TPA: UDP-forming cellulose synthase catalytic subunit [Klebsiella pneumoniae]